MITIHHATRERLAGRLSCVRLLETCLEHIDRHEPQVRAWVLIDRPRARAEAEARDEELKRGYDRGPLHGIPMGIKDIIDVFDWPTACGSRLWKNSFARHDAPVVERLRHAGAVLIGKTVTTQYASFDPPPTRNPWNLSRTPGGSSSGSAAAVASGMCLATLGSQTGGSITRPASYCGVTACKPTFGRASTQGVLPLAHSMDHIGPMANDVRDVALVMQTISDPPVANWSAGLHGEKPPRLGRLRGLFEAQASPEMRDMMDRVWRKLLESGADGREAGLPASFDPVIQNHRALMAVESALYHRERYARHPEDYDRNIRILLDEGIAFPAVDYARAKEHQRLLKDEMRELFQGDTVLICPATTMPAPDAATTGDPAFNSPWSYTGLPVVSLPVALSQDGMPLAVQLVGRAWGERELFAAAAWVEDVLGWERRLPAGLK